MLLYEAPAAAGTLSEKTDKAAFWFAAEEHVMRDLAPGEPVLMLWRTRDTAMVGANQVAEAEVDRAYAEKDGIDIVRRASGGGTIFTDAGTLLYTILLPYDAGTDPKDVVRDRLAAPVIRALASLGVPARLEGRNDLLIDGRKFSGIAQHIAHGALCSHGSLLWDADLAMLARVLTPARAKIVSKAIPSARARVTNIAEHLAPRSGDARPSDIDAFREALVRSWAEEASEVAEAASEVAEAVDAAEATTAADAAADAAAATGSLTRRPFSPEERAAIAQIAAEKYENPSWTFGRAPAYTVRRSARFPGGGVEVFFAVERGTITACRITGDFLALRPVAPLEAALAGIPYRRADIAVALSRADAQAILGSITAEEFLSVCP